uniref:Intraflagellar transport protein 20 homolog n=1 Tax=Caenorhabditis japonica TaxID=281687 RepID=A0A8R1HTC6_CAEJA
MGDEHLAKAGLFVDDFNRLRLIDPEAAELLQTAQDKSTEFNEQLKNFKTTTGGLIDSIEEFAKVVETEKIRAMMSRNTQERDAAEDDPVLLQMTIRELTVEKERLRVELEAVKKIEKEQEEYIQMMTEH